MRLSLKIFIGLIFSIFIVFSILTLDLFPLPWFDETYYASIALNFIEKGNFIAPITFHAREGKETLTYGPLYFLFTGLSIKIFSFGIFQFRLITMISGILCILMTGLIMHQQKKNFLHVSGIIAIMAFDPFLNLSMHEGRMDLLAVFFILASVYFILKNENEKNFLISGAFALLSLLTTPRSLVIVVAISLFLIIHLIKNKNTFHIILFITPIILLYPIWIWYAFGGPNQFFDYYHNLERGVHSANVGYLGGRFYIPKHEYLLILVSIFLSIIALVQKRRAVINNLFIISILSIVLFYCIVLDWGPYSVFIIPFYYLIIFNSIIHIDFKQKYILYIPIFILAFFNLSIFIFKNAKTLSEKSIRDPEMADEFIRKNIPSGSNVLGDGLHYYFVIKSGSNYELYNKYDSALSREQKHREGFDYDYLIISKYNEGNAESKIYFKNSLLIKAAILNPENNSFLKSINLGMSDMEKHGYSCIIYKRIKNYELQEDYVAQHLSH